VWTCKSHRTFQIAVQMLQISSLDMKSWLKVYFLLLYTLRAMRECVQMRRVEFVYFDAGGGHRAAATALRIVTEQQLQWNIHLMNLQELLDGIDPVLKLTGLRLQDLYNGLLKKGWTWGTGFGLRVFQAAIRLYHQDQVRLLEAYWRQSQPALVVSLVPHFN